MRIKFSVKITNNVKGITMFIKNFNEPPVNISYYHLKIQNGIGDAIWALTKLCNLDLPLYLEVSSAKPYRPDRTGPLLDHLPFVIGWKYSETHFNEPNEWISASHPSNFYGVTFADSHIKPNVLTKICANKFLEDGGKISEWLPDIPTNYHFPIESPRVPPTIDVPENSVVLHFNGWPEIDDNTFISIAGMSAEVATVFILVGSYDYRSPLAYKIKEQVPSVRLAIDLEWEDFYELLTKSKYIIGQCSGATILANVLYKPGCVIIPRALPHLKGWADPDFKDQIIVSTTEEFKEYANKLRDELENSTSQGHIPEFISSAASQGYAESSTISRYNKLFDPTAHNLPHSTHPAYYSLGRQYKPQVVLFLGEHTPENTAAFVTGVLDAGVPILSITFAGEYDLEACTKLCTPILFRSSRISLIYKIPGNLKEILRSKKLGNVYSGVVVHSQQNNLDYLLTGWKSLTVPGTLFVASLNNENQYTAYSEFSKIVGLSYPPSLFNFGIVER